MATPRQLVADYDAKQTIDAQKAAAEAASKDAVTTAQAALAAATADRQAADQDVSTAKSALDAGLPENVPYPFNLNGKNVIVINLHGDAQILLMGDPDADLTPPPPPAPAPGA